jgi:hypothetical protein
MHLNMKVRRRKRRKKLNDSSLFQRGRVLNCDNNKNL